MGTEVIYLSLSRYIASERDPPSLDETPLFHVSGKYEFPLRDVLTGGCDGLECRAGYKFADNSGHPVSNRVEVGVCFLVMSVYSLPDASSQEM